MKKISAEEETYEIYEPSIKLKGNLNDEDHRSISALQEECTREDSITLKLELDYKLGAALADKSSTGIQKINEFMYFDRQRLIGYIGICDFGGAGSPLEITGMVDPKYRRNGIFYKLHELVMAECKRRNAADVLLLCDKNSVSGQNFLKRIGAVYRYSEFEMYLKEEAFALSEEQLCGITFRKAVNTDAREIARQNTIYFDDTSQSGELGSGESDPDILLPEDEEKRGMTIYIAEKDRQAVGKVHLQISAAVSGIYGLGVLPEYRGRGFGRAILLRAVEKLKEAESKAIMLQVAAENATALNLYQSCGFQETSVMDYYGLNCL